jgi:hypothetical protein
MCKNITKKLINVASRPNQTLNIKIKWLCLTKCTELK